MSQPWSGLTLSVPSDGIGLLVQVDETGPSAALPKGARLIAISAQNEPQSVTLEALDLTEEPDTLSTPQILARFLKRQQTLFHILSRPTVSLSYQTVQGTLETITIQPLPLRPLAELPILFWLHLCAGVVSLVLAAWVALQRSSDPAGRIAFAMACAGLWLVTHGAALYATRELALNVAQFKTASAINYIGSFVGGIGLVNLFLVCPTRIARPWQLWIAPLLIVPIALLSLANLDGFEVSRQVTVMIVVLAFVALVIVQTIKCWRDPVARAVMTWLGIAVIICSVVYVVAIIIPALTGQDQKITQGPALVIILVFYITLGVAVARYRLYALPDLSMRLLFYVGGLVPLLLLDAGLIYLLSFEAAPALGLSLALVGLFYLPLRARMFTWFGRNKTPPPEEVFKRINEVVLATDHIARRGAFEALFQWLFAPMQIRAAPAPVANAQLIGNGEALRGFAIRKVSLI